MRKMKTRAGRRIFASVLAFTLAVATAAGPVGLSPGVAKAAGNALVDGNSEFEGWTESGSHTFSQEAGVLSLTNFQSSGSTWYDPQIKSPQFSVEKDKTYELTFKAKLSGENNGKFDWIVQEQGGSWPVVAGFDSGSYEQPTYSAGTETPDATTEDPDATTEDPDATTEAPDVTTEDPDATTEAPDATTETPVAPAAEPADALAQTKTADGDGFETYRYTFTSSISSDKVALAIGAGRSGFKAENKAENAFIVKDVSINEIQTVLGGTEEFITDGCSLTQEDGVLTVAEFVSGANWYSPQFKSAVFDVEEDEAYVLTFKAKMDSTRNFDFNLQVDGSLANNDWTTIYGYDTGNADNGYVQPAYDAAAQENGFATYTYAFTAPASKSNVRLGFGMGRSGATAENKGAITVKDIWLYKVGGAEADTSTGAEYDFSADNSAYDFADPGKTKDGYELIWADEFDGNYGDGADVDQDTGLNLGNWEAQLGDGTVAAGNQGWGNKELQCYTDRKANIGVNEDLNGDDDGDGLLRITAKYEEDGYVYENETKKNYTSARLRTTKGTEALFNTTYGYIESRMSLPATKGAWPAFWMLPESLDIYGAWPVSGEIDIMETVGSFGNDVHDAVCSTLHWGAPNHVYKGGGYNSKALSSDYTYFHTYAVDWEPGKMTWYYDGEKAYELENWESMITGASDSLAFDAPFDQPFHILLNLAVDSGQFGGAVNRATFQDRINMYVDYVRVYQKTEGYGDSPERADSGAFKEDWENYAGQNQTDTLTKANVKSEHAAAYNDAEDSGETSGWNLSYQSGFEAATAEGVTVDGKDYAKVYVPKAGGEDYAVQLIGHYNAKAGYAYKISFDAYGDGGILGKTLVCAAKEHTNWSTYGSTQFELTDTPKTYSFLVNQAEDFDTCRVEFDLGASAEGNVYLGNIKVEIINPEELGIVEHPALDDGNIIYNGTFDQGNHYVGYWTAGADTTLKVPRYTIAALKDDDLSVVDVASKTNYESRKTEKPVGGVKYYERRAQISAAAGKTPSVYQAGFAMPADTYTLNLDLYSAAATSVTAKIVETNPVLDAKGKVTSYTLTDKVLASKTIDYAEAAKGKVKSYEWTFGLAEKLENAALVLSFADGASVQIDNVSLIGQKLAPVVDKTPVDAETGFTKDGTGTLTEADGVRTLSDFVSGSDWWAPQIISDDFALLAGKKYKLTFKAKMTGSSNKFDYIVQENQGGWAVFAGFGKYAEMPTYDAASDALDADGYMTYETEFTAGVSLPKVHVVFGLGNSEVSTAGDCTFSFKDVSLIMVESEEEGGDVEVVPGNGAIKYELDGGVNAAANPSAYEVGATVTLQDATKTGYEFLGWSLTQDGTPSKNLALDTSKAGLITVYASWKQSEQPTTGEQPTTAPTTGEQPTTAPTTGEQPTTAPTTEQPVVPPEKGATVQDESGSNGVYKVDVSSVTNGEVIYTKPATKQGTVTIPDTITVGGVAYKVTSIAKNAFKNDKKLTKVTIGSNIKTIGASAFEGCKKLKTLKLGKNVKTIGDKAFKGCTALTKVTIPSKVTKLGKEAFANCSKLATVTMGVGVTEIGASAFSKCTKLKKIIIPSKVKKIGKKAFYNCKALKNIQINTTKLTTKNVGASAFKGTPKNAVVKVPKNKLSAYKTLLVKKGLNKKATVKKR